MLLKQFPSGPFETNAYVFALASSAIVIDPAPDSGPLIVEALKDLNPQGIYLTHSHWDHIGDVAFLKEKLDIPVYVHALDAPNLEKPGTDGLPMMFPIHGVQPDGYLEDQFLLDDQFIAVIHTPGHTPGGVCFYLEQEKILFSGDTLFKGSIGNLSFPTANADAMWQSLEKLVKLPSDTQVYPGHGPATTIGSEPWLENAKELFS